MFSGAKCAPEFLLKFIMLEFTRLEKQALELKDFFEKSEIEFCDISVGSKFMWRDDNVIDYTVYNDTLIMKETCSDYENAFYYPIGKDVEGAFSEIENYVKEKKIPLKFCCIDNKHAAILSLKYPCSEIHNLREWSDYIYDAEAFKGFVGKKYSGQRNHINKFKKLYPDYRFVVLNKSDEKRVEALLKEYESGEEFSAWSKREEEKKALELYKNLEELKLFAGGIFVGDKLVAFSIGERVKDTLIVHVEKALKSYEGVYPLMANEFAKNFANNGVKFINREEDCGDMGLRISKLQYHPIEVKEKNTVSVFTLAEKKEPVIDIKTERLSVSAILDSDKAEYYKLYTDEKVNKYYGYDYREDCSNPTPEYFYKFQEKLKKEEKEFSFAVKLDGKLIGEIVLYNFGFDGSTEIGFRFMQEFWHKGYATESVSAVLEYALMNYKKVRAKAFKENLSSIKLIKKLAFNSLKEDEKYYYFIKENK